MQGPRKKRTLEPDRDLHPGNDLHPKAFSGHNGRPDCVDGVVIGHPQGRQARLFSCGNKVLGREISVRSSGVVVQVSIKWAFHLCLLVKWGKSDRYAENNLFSTPFFVEKSESR